MSASTINVGTLHNGLVVITERIETVRSASCALLVPAGAARDDEDAAGTASVCSEALMRAAGGRSSREVADAFELLGASRGCDAGLRFTHMTATSLGDKLPDALSLVAQSVLEPAFEPEGVEASKELAAQSILSLADDPQQRAGLAARARHFAPPFNLSGLGTPEGIAQVTPERLRLWWSSHAVPGGSILAIAGHIDEDEVRAHAERLFGGWSGTADPVEPEGEAPRGLGHEADDSSQVQIIAMHDAPHAADPDGVLARIANAVLSGGMSGRLFTEVREKRGLCYSVSSAYRPEREFGSVSAYVGTTPERAQEALDVLLAELRRLGKEGGMVTRPEFDRAVVGLKSKLVFAGESTGARAGALALDQHRLGRPRPMEELSAEIDAVTPELLAAYLERRKLGKLTVQTLGPRELTCDLD